MTDVNWDGIDRVVYINLNRRKDRRVHVARQLKALGVPQEKIIRLAAVEHNPGYIGCTASHILALQMAQENGWSNVLILEDDIEFHQDNDTKNRLNKFFTTLQNIKWHVAFLAANYYNVTDFKSVDYLVKVNKAWCACAYLVNSSYYRVLLDNYIGSLNALQQGGAQQNYALDVHWHTLMARDYWLGIFPNAGFQGMGKSDIERRIVDYRALFAKPLTLITTHRADEICQLPLRVDFYFQWAPGWNCFESVLKAMQASGKFDCQVIVLPYMSYGAKSPDCSVQQKLLADKGISFVPYRDYSLAERRPHAVFLQNPYDEARPEAFRSENLHRHNINIAYIPYGLDMGDGEKNRVYQYNLPCHNRARWVFVRSERHKNEYGRHCHAGNEHVYVTGHPKLDNYAARYGKQGQNDQPGKLKTLLWTPHFVMPDSERMWSTFNLYTPVMLEIMARDDIRLIIRPHPLFQQFLDIRIARGAGDETRQNLQRLRDASEGKENVIWDFSPDYEKSFAHSDALMADAGSFLLEYLPSCKPVLFLTHESRLGINSSADFIYQAYDIAFEEKAILQFVDNLVNGLDPHRETRLEVLKNELYFSSRSAGHEIADVILQALTGKTGENNAS